MTLSVGANSYVTLEEANSYASSRLWTTWAALADDVKTARLLEAASYLDNSYVWGGRIADQSQVMSWPRIHFKDKEQRYYSSSTTPEAIKTAQVELANLAETALVESQTEGSVQSVQAGSVSVTFKDGQQVSEQARMRPIDRILTGLYLSRVGSNIVRLTRA